MQPVGCMTEGNVNEGGTMPICKCCKKKYKKTLTTKSIFDVPSIDQSTSGNLAMREQEWSVEKLLENFVCAKISQR